MIIVDQILRCPNGHYFVETSQCPHCGAEACDAFELREGDCVYCGELCPGYAYGCTLPTPLSKPR